MIQRCGRREMDVKSDPMQVFVDVCKLVVQAFFDASRKYGRHRMSRYEWRVRCFSSSDATVGQSCRMTADGDALRWLSE